VIAKNDFSRLKDGCILINSGRYGEIDVESLEQMTREKHTIRGEPESVTEYLIAARKGHKSIYVVACSFPVNLYVGSGNPKEVLDLIFALMLECLAYIYKHHKKLKNKLLPAPQACIKKISNMFLKVHGYPPKSG